MYGSRNWESPIFETYDCFENQIDSEDVAFQELDWNQLIRRLDLYISVMQSLAYISVTIEKIQIAEQGVLTTGTNLGVMGEELHENTNCPNT